MTRYGPPVINPVTKALREIAILVPSIALDPAQTDNATRARQTNRPLQQKHAPPANAPTPTTAQIRNPHRPSPSKPRVVLP